MRGRPRPLAANPDLRARLVELHRRNEQVIDLVTIDEELDASYDPAALDLARNTVDTFRRYIESHKDEITVLDLLYSRPYGQRALTYRDIQELAAVLEQPPYSWTTERLWQAYAQVEQDKVRGVGSQRRLTDLICWCATPCSCKTSSRPIWSGCSSAMPSGWRTRPLPGAALRPSSAGGWTASPSRSA